MHRGSGTVGRCARAVATYANTVNLRANAVIEKIQCRVVSSLDWWWFRHPKQGCRGSRVDQWCKCVWFPWAWERGRRIRVSRASELLDFKNRAMYVCGREGWSDQSQVVFVERGKNGFAANDEDLGAIQE